MPTGHTQSDAHQLRRKMQSFERILRYRSFFCPELAGPTSGSRLCCHRYWSLPSLPEEKQTHLLKWRSTTPKFAVAPPASLSRTPVATVKVAGRL